MTADLARLDFEGQGGHLHVPSEGVGPIGAEEGMASSSSRPRFVPLAVDGPAVVGVSASGPSGELEHD